MNPQEKQQIQTLLLSFIEKMGSQNKAARSMNVSSATISQIMNNNWDLIAEEMWRTIGAHVGYSSIEWNYVETKSFRLIQDLLKDSQENSNVFAFVGESGCGKTSACRAYCNENKNAFLLKCSDYWNKKHFLSELLSLLGRDSSGLNVFEMMSMVVNEFKGKYKPLLIIDEADKLKDEVLYFFITLYNELEDFCGMVLCATDNLEKRIKRGLKLNKKGYKEIFSRIGRKFIEIAVSVLTDVVQVCLANGISDPKIQREIHFDANGDMRRVKRMIHALKKQ